VATALNVSRLVIGLTLVGIGTSLPELVTSVRAALVGSPGIAVGNIVGSNTANVLLILGVAAMIYPLATPRDSVIRNGGMLALTTLLMVGITLHGFLDRAIGGALVALLIVYFIYSYVRDRRMTAANAGRPYGDDDIVSPNVNTMQALLMAGAGIALVILGARWLVDSSIDLARTYGISETFIGLTVVAVGTSLPELVTTVIAALRKQTAIGVGNILGSNILNILGILGITAVIQPIPIPEQIMQLDIWIMAGATALFLIFAASNWRLSRLEGFLMLLAYAGYIALLTYLDVLPALETAL
jgi:cation:H+ antiporter